MRPGDRRATLQPLRLVRTTNQNWYAESWQKKFHYFSEGQSLCGRYWLLDGVPRDDFEHRRNLPTTCRCKKCERAYEERRKKK